MFASYKKILTKNNNNKKIKIKSNLAISFLFKRWLEPAPTYLHRSIYTPSGTLQIKQYRITLIIIVTLVIVIIIIIDFITNNQIHLSSEFEHQNSDNDNYSKIPTLFSFPFSFSFLQGFKGFAKMNDSKLFLYPNLQTSSGK